MKDMDKTVVGTLAVMAVIALLAVTFLGGQTNGILSTVGASVDSREAGSVEEAGAPPEGETEAGPGDAALQDGTKVVRTGSLDLLVEALDPALSLATDRVRTLDGYIAASHQSIDGGATAVIDFRLPSDRWDEALEALRPIGTKRLAEETKSIDVSGQLVDLTARISNLDAAQRALQGIAAKATTIKDVLEVQKQLTEVRGQIERLTAERVHVEDQASYGTLSVTFTVQVVALDEAAKQWDPRVDVDRAAATLVDVLRAVASVGIWIGIVWLPVLLGLGLIGAVAAFVFRRVRAMTAT